VSSWSQACATKRDVVAGLSAAAGSMSEETKEEVIRAAYLTLLADKGELFHAFRVSVGQQYPWFYLGLASGVEPELSIVHRKPTLEPEVSMR
jgi:hypothetical protein